MKNSLLAIMALHTAAFQAKAQAFGNYEKREDPTIKSVADTLDKIATNVDEFKSSQSDKLSQIEKEVERMQVRMARPGAFTGSLGDDGSLSTRGGPSIEERKAFGEFLRTGERKASVNVSTSGQGQEAVAPWFDDVVLRMSRANTPLLKIIRTRKVSNFPCKHVVGNAKLMNFGWTGELGERVGTDAPKPLVVEVQAGEWWALPSITEWALTDVAFDVSGWLQQELVDKYSEAMMNAIVTGDGLNKPKGFLAGPTPVTTGDLGRAFGTLQYIPTGQAAALATNMLDMLLDVVHSLAWMHRQNASWLMNATTLSTLRKVKDTTGQPILIESTVAGMPNRLLGYPVIETESMPPVSANTFPIAFGDFDAGYVLDEDAEGMRITRDDITQKGFVQFYARRRCGGAVLNSDAIKLVKVATS